MDCIFCKITSGDVPTSKIYEDGTVIVSFDINPASLGHLIIFPKKHYEDLGDVPPQDFLNIMSVVRFFSSILKEAVSPKGFNVIISVGEVKNQQTSHLTIHLIPVSGGEEIVLGWKPARPNEEEIVGLAKTLQEIMTRKMQEAREKIKEHSDEIVQVRKGGKEVVEKKEVPKKEQEEPKEEPKEEPEDVRRLSP